jgi:hypothetical protein
VSQLCEPVIRKLNVTLQNGGLDKYLLNESSDLLGWEGMRLRIKLHDRIRENRSLGIHSPTEYEPTAPAALQDQHFAEDGKTFYKVRSLHDAPRKPTLEDARRQRVEAATALGAYKPLRYDVS